MRMSNRRRGLAVVEVIIMGVVLSVIVAMLIPAIDLARDSSCMKTCANNLKAIGIAFHEYAAVHKLMPSSSSVTRDADGVITAVDGWSWLVQILPYMQDTTTGGIDTQKLYDSLDIAGGRPLVEPAGVEGTPHADALAVSLPGLLCPSYAGCSFADPTTKREAITNYKPFGATHIESLSVASANPQKPKYDPDGERSVGKRSRHPDGACFPGKYFSYVEIRNGTSNTLLAAETIEPRFARWTVGAEAAVVGLPRIVEYEKVDYYYSPKWLKQDASWKITAKPGYWTYRTYLDWDCDKYPYDGMDGTHGGKYGPRSAHAGKTNHLLLDASCHAITNGCDVALYMGLITPTD